MGNCLAGIKMVKVMKQDGQTFKLTCPVKVSEVAKLYPGHVLIEHEAAKRYGVRARPLESKEELKPGNLYFLLENMAFRHVYAGAENRLRSLVSSHQSKQTRVEARSRRIKIRLSKVEVAKAIQQSKDVNEAAEKIVDLCVRKRLIYSC